MNNGHRKFNFVCLRKYLVFRQLGTDANLNLVGQLGCYCRCGVQVQVLEVELGVVVGEEVMDDVAEELRVFSHIQSY